MINLTINKNQFTSSEFISLRSLIKDKLDNASVGFQIIINIEDDCFIKLNDDLLDSGIINISIKLTIKSVLFDESRLYCENLIRIEKDAQKVVASEQNKNLLIGEKSRVVSIPKLEVEANDVSCQHGAAISKLNNDHLFYLQSR